MHAVIMSLAVCLTGQTAEGDAGLLAALRTAQKANVGRYPHGEIEAVVTIGQTGELNIHERSEVKVRWKGQSSRSITSKRAMRGAKPLDLSQLPDQMLVMDHWIVDEKRSILYSTIAHTVLIRTLAKFQPPPDARCDPQSFWYGGMGGGQGMPNWQQLFDPAKFRGKTPRDQISYKVRPLDADRVELSRLDQKLNAPLVAVCSLGMDGNVVSYEFNMPKSHYTTRGSCDWKRDAQGRCYLAKLDHRTAYADHSAETFLTYEITSFRPDVVPRAEEFAMKSLPLTGVVTVRDMVTGRSYGVGDPPIEDVRSSLNGLIDSLKRKGFAREDRK